MDGHSVFLHRWYRRWELLYRSAPRPLWRPTGSAGRAARLLCGARRQPDWRRVTHRRFRPAGTLLAYAHPVKARLADPEVVVADVIGRLGDHALRPARLSFNAHGHRGGGQRAFG